MNKWDFMQWGEYRCICLHRVGKVGENVGFCVVLVLVCGFWVVLVGMNKWVNIGV